MRDVVDGGASVCGREAELEALARAGGRARSGHAQVVVVEGEPGIGKSALLASFADGAGLGPVRWLRCDEFEKSHRFGAVGRLLEDESLGGCSEVEVGRRLLAWFGEQQGSGEDVALVVV